MRKSRVLLMAVCSCLISLAAVPSLSWATEVSPLVETAAPAETAAPGQGISVRTEDTIYIGEISTRLEDQWECEINYAVKNNIEKNYDTLVGNVLHVTAYSTIPLEENCDFYIAMDNHIEYMDGKDTFDFVGKNGDFYAYEKDIRVIKGGTFDLTVANKNATLYSGLYDTATLTAYDSIKSLAFFVEQNAGNQSTMNFYVTANGSSTAIITADTEGFNPADNEWKIVTAEKNEKVLFADTEYNGYTFDPEVISLKIHMSEEAQANPTTIQVYYLGLINGRLFTVGPYSFPARTNTYSSMFELDSTNLDVLSTESSFVVNAYIEAGRTAEMTVTDPDRVASIKKITPVTSDVEGMDKVAVTVNVSDTSKDLNLLIGNRWSANQVAYNYRKLHVNFLRDIQSLSVTATQTDHYHITYEASVNDQSNLDTKAVNWYINDQIQPEHGLTLNVEFTKGGQYTVYAQLGTINSNSITTKIIYSDWQTIFWYVLAAAALIAAAIALWYHFRFNGARYDNHLRDRIKAMLELAEDTQKKLIEGKISVSAALRTVYQIGWQLGNVNDGLRDRYRASNVQAYREASLKVSNIQNEVKKAKAADTKDKYFARAVLDLMVHSLRGALDEMAEIAVLSSK